ncbi:MAG: DUF5047 domain-containing protein [Dermatophilaceae bacterium]
MIAVSPLFQEAVRYSRSFFTVMDVVLGSGEIVSNVPVVSGSVTDDRSSKARLSATVEMGLYPWDDVVLDAYTTRFRLFRGLESLGYRELVQLGEFRVNELRRTNYGSLEITGKGLENYVIDARFLRPRVPPYGSSTIAAIRSLILEVMPSAVIDVTASTDRVVTSTAPWEKERWDACLTLAESINADVFVRHSGRFVIKDTPTLSSPPVYTIDLGDGGVLVEEEVNNSREGVYNGVSVSGQSSDPKVKPAWALAIDNNPASPTYWLGGFGQVPRFYSSQYIATNAQAQQVANNMLAAATARNRTLTFNTVPLVFLESGDLVYVELTDGTFENHLLQKISYPLGGGDCSYETLAGKASEA